MPPSARTDCGVKAAADSVTVRKAQCATGPPELVSRTVKQGGWAKNATNVKYIQIYSIKIGFVRNNHCSTFMNEKTLQPQCKMNLRYFRSVSDWQVRQELFI